jgi:4-amino-4-deoxy-L-arabinose transferase-like glycosyltransferase
MTLSDLSSAKHDSHAGLLGYLIVLAVGLFAFFYRLGELPLAPWDEARLANNALEMAHNGHWLVTTFDGQVDTYNTKPPFLIWLMSGAIRAFGATEWSVRLPSALAALSTCLVLYAFCTHYLRRPLAGVFAALALMSCLSVIDFHAARAGDYDSMLTFLMTSYLLAAFLYLETARGRLWWLAFATIAVTLAFLTKTVQGLIFLPAMGVYTWYRGRLGTALRTPAVYAAILLTVGACAGYYILREQVDPGHFAIALRNDILGRYATVIDGHQGDFFWYRYVLQRVPWVPLAIVCAIVTLRAGNDVERRINAYLAGSACFYLLVISSAKTKLFWYVLPLYPLFALIVAVGLAPVARLIPNPSRLSRAARYRLASAALGAMSLVVVTQSYWLIHQRERLWANSLPDQYSLFLRTLPHVSPTHRVFAVVHPGYPHSFEPRSEFYVAPALFYVNVLRDAGYDIAIVPPDAALPPRYSILVACGQVTAELHRHNRMYTEYAAGDCRLLRRRRVYE